VQTLKELSWLRIFAEGGAIVVSILLAFAIDAAWDRRQEQHEERRILHSVLNELHANQQNIARMTVWQRDVEAATISLLDAAARSEVAISVDAIDQLIADSSWYNNDSTFDMSAVDAVVLGGNLSKIEDENLRQRITQWSRDVSIVRRNERQDYDFFKDVWTPFLRQNAYMPQIHNFVDELPGTGEEDYIPDIKLSSHAGSHADLIGDREFQNILLQRLWIHGDILNAYRQIEPRLDSLVDLVSAELER
jgi:glycerol-3-phosphate cytidylyltransferase-like family protein